MSTLLRFLFCGMILFAPWLAGAVSLVTQFYLFVGFTGIAIVRWGQHWYRGDQLPAIVPLALFVPLVMSAIGMIQLWGLSGPLLPQLTSATLADQLPAITTELATASPDLAVALNHSGSINPCRTELVLAQIALLTLVFWLGFDLFDHTEARRWAFTVLAFNGAAIAVFGLAQQISWNGKLFWAIPLRYGGSPFGPFVNRNNGAGFLLVALGGAVASVTAAWFPFGVSRGTARTGSLRLQLSAILLQLLGRLTPRVLIPGTFLVCIVMGIVSSMSRGGVVALGVIALVLIPCVARLRSRLLLVLAGGVLLAGGALYLAGRAQFVAGRMGTLLHLSEALDGRLTLWGESLRAAGDVAPWGSGWGTFRDLQAVYEDRDDMHWNNQAENQYLETLVEAGPVALMAMIAGLGLCLYAAIRAFRDDTDGRLMDSALWGMTAVTGLACHSITDFSLVIAGVAIPFFGYLGISLAALCRQLELPRGILCRLRLPAGHLVVTGLLILASGIGLFRMQQEAAVQRVLDRVPMLDSPLLITREQADDALADLETIALRYPWHPDIWRAISRLRIYRCRLMVFQSLRQKVPAQNESDRDLWTKTSLLWIHGAVLEPRQISLKAEADFLSHPAFQENLPLAREALQRVLRLSPLQREAAMEGAWLEHIYGDAETTRGLVKLAAYSSPGIASVMHQAGTLSYRLGDQPAALALWRRGLEIADLYALEIWKQANVSLPEEELEREIVPDRPQILLQIAPLLFDLDARARMLDRCGRAISADPTVAPEWVARYRLQIGDLAGSIEQFLLAIRKAPRDIELRLEVATVMEQAGRLTDARSQLGVCQGLAPQRPDIRKRFEDLIERESAEAAPPQRDNPSL